MKKNSKLLLSNDLLRVINSLFSKTNSSFWKWKELLRASAMSKMKSLLAEVQTAARTHVCQDSGIDAILSRQPFNVTDTRTLYMVEDTETYETAFQDLSQPTVFWKCAKHPSSFWYFP